MSHVKKRTDEGFSIIETLVAIAVLALALGGPMTLAQQGLTSAFLARNQVTATFLAQEGVEFIRNERDENILSGNDWLNGLGSCVSSDGSAECRIDVRTGNIDACSGGCPPLRFDSASGFYTYGTGEETPYTRTISIEELNSREVAITVELAWQRSGIDRSFSVQENMLNWQQ